MGIPVVYVCLRVFECAYMYLCIFTLVISLIDKPVLIIRKVISCLYD